MNKYMVSSSRSGMTTTSSHLASVYGKDFLELVWENGQILAADNRTRNIPICIGYSVNPSHKNEDDMRTSKRARLSNNSYSYKPNNQEFPNTAFTAAASNSHSHPYSSKQCQKPRIDSSLTPTKKSQKQYLGSSSCDQRTRKKVNFSNFSIPAVFLKSTSARINASSARVEKIELKAAEVASTRNKEQTSFTANKSKPESPLAVKSVEPQPPMSEALKEKRKADDETNLCNERSSSSVCSLEASNNPNFSIKNHEDTDDDDSAYLSDDDEETENLVRDSNRSHSLSERKQRDKINEKILTLKDLIPNCNKVDKASMLDDAIDYLKTLKFQLEIMSMGTRGLCMPLMMLPHQMNGGAQHLMGFRPGNGGTTPCTPPPPPQFPIPPLSSVTDNRVLQMFGFSNQIVPPPMTIPNAPLFPMIRNSSTQPFNATNTHSYKPGKTSG